MCAKKSVANFDEEPEDTSNDGSRDEQELDEPEVGYCRPPEHTQFKKGESGNPSGRPKKPRESLSDIKKYISDELREEVTITEGEQRKKTSKNQLYYKSLVNDAIAGKASACRMLFEIIKEISDPEEFNLSENENEFLDKYLEDLDRDVVQDDIEDQTDRDGGAEDEN